MSLSAGLEPYHTERPTVLSTTGSSSRATGAGAAGAAAGGFGLTRSVRVSETLIDGARSAETGHSFRERSMITSEPAANHDGGGVHQEQDRDQDQDPTGGDGLEFRVRLTRVIVNLDRQRGIAV